MKKILLAILLLPNLLLAQYKVPDYVQNYYVTRPTVLSTDVKGGLHIVPDSAAKANIPILKRELGMYVSFFKSGKLITQRYDGISTNDIHWLPDSNWTSFYTQLEIDSIIGTIGSSTYDAGNGIDIISNTISLDDTLASNLTVGRYGGATNATFKYETDGLTVTAWNPTYTSEYKSVTSGQINTFTYGSNSSSYSYAAGGISNLISNGTENNYNIELPEKTSKAIEGDISYSNCYQTCDTFSFNISPFSVKPPDFLITQKAVTISDTLGTKFVKSPTTGLYDDISYLIKPPHAWIRFADSTRTIALTQNTWAQITNPADSLFRVIDQYLLSVEDDTVSATVAGHFNVDFSLSFTGTNADIYEVRLMSTTGEIHKVSISTDGTAPHEVVVPGYWIATAGQELWAEIRNTASNDDATVLSGGLRLLYIHR